MDAAPPGRKVSGFDAVRISSNPEAEFFQRATTEVDFGSEPVARARLIVELESPCFPFDRWTRDSIPEGHNWPRLCDAFDRTLLLSLDDPSDPDAGVSPGLELVRAITPFGGPLQLDVDVTDVVNGRLGSHELTVDIQTYGDGEGVVSGAEGEWIVSAHFELQAGPPPRKVLAVVPLFFGFEKESEPKPVPFRVPRGTRSGRIEYRATGHGGGAIESGCIGPAEEFCRRQHTLAVDASQLGVVNPWRDDCATLCSPASYSSDFLSIDQYCAENPCGAMESVRAPRANWCPGSVTPPFVFEDPILSESGGHELALAVNRIADGGLWLLSATYFAYE